MCLLQIMYPQSGSMKSLSEECVCVWGGGGGGRMRGTSVINEGVQK